MEIKRIKFMEDVRDVNNDNIDVLVEKEDGSNYIVTVGTPQDLLEKMNQEKTNFIRPGTPMIIVKKLTKEIVREAIQAYGEDDGYWLKLHHFADSIDIYVLNKLEAEYRKERKEFAILRGLEKLQDDINKLEKLDNLEKSKLVDRLDKLSDELFED
jgi:hypothetical protein